VGPLVLHGRKGLAGLEIGIEQALRLSAAPRFLAGRKWEPRAAPGAGRAC
jgi:hypothetical protein